MSDQPEADGRLRQIKWLQTLYEASTAGKWYAENVELCPDRTAYAVVLLDNGDKRDTSIFDTMNADEVEIARPGDDFGGWYDVQGMKNATFAAEAHNEMPWLLACARELVDADGSLVEARELLTKAREQILVQQKMIDSLTARVDAQSEIIGRSAEREPSPGGQK